MTTRIGLISDIHAHPEPLREALALFEHHDVELVLCPGDTAGYGDALDETVEVLAASRCQSILGNHEVWYLEKTETPTKETHDYFRSLPRTREFSLEGRTIFMVHASPHDSYMEGVRLLDKRCEVDVEQVRHWSGKLAEFDYDVLIVGHTHQVFAEQVGSTLVINPGSAPYNHSCAILTLPDMSVDFFGLSGKQIQRCWNWAQQFRQG